MIQFLLELTRSERYSITERRYDSLQAGGIYTVHKIRLLEDNMTVTISRLGGGGAQTRELGIECGQQ